MNTRFVAAVAAVSFGGATLALGGTVSAAPPSCNWGQLTKHAILDLGFEQGVHSSDPSGDGRGPEDRVGLANVVERGDLEATCALITVLLEAG